MKMEVNLAAAGDVQAMRELYRKEAACQIIHDSCISRGLADPYVIHVNGRLAGYGAVWNKYDPGRLMEFYTVPHFRGLALPMFRELLIESRATQIEAQSNMPRMLLMLYDCATNIRAENVLFHDAFDSNLECSGGIFRRSVPEDASLMFPHKDEPVGDWVLEVDGAPVSTGGFLCHYNPPYGDVYMEVAEPMRRRGLGSYLVQEVKRRCYEAGKLPAARCNPGNVASRGTLQKAGFLPCARLMVGDVEAAPARK